MEEVSTQQNVHPVAQWLLSALSQVSCDNSKQNVEWEDEGNTAFDKERRGVMVDLSCHFGRILNYQGNKSLGQSEEGFLL